MSRDADAQAVRGHPFRVRSLKSEPGGNQPRCLGPLWSADAYRLSLGITHRHFQGAVLFIQNHGVRMVCCGSSVVTTKPSLERLPTIRTPPRMVPCAEIPSPSLLSSVPEKTTYGSSLPAGAPTKKMPARAHKRASDGSPPLTRRGSRRHTFIEWCVIRSSRRVNKYAHLCITVTNSHRTHHCSFCGCREVSVASAAPTTNRGFVL